VYISPYAAGCGCAIVGVAADGSGSSL
jgi:hypothetical protein